MRGVKDKIFTLQGVIEKKITGKPKLVHIVGNKHIDGFMNGC
jgi:hypothetical protein